VREETSEEVSHDSIEDRARKQGWRPIDEWDGDPEDWVGPEAFVVRGELFNKIKNQSKTINELNTVVQDLKQHHEKTSEREYERALNYLKAQKKEALEDGEHDRVMEIDDKISETQKDWDKQKQEAAAKPTVNPDFEQWVEDPKNKWYVENKVLRAAADRLAEEYASQKPNATFEEVVQHVETELKDDIPTGRKPKPQTRVNEPSYSGQRGSQGGKSLVGKLNEEQLAVGKRFVRRKVFNNLNDYAKELQKNGDI